MKKSIVFDFDGVIHKYSKGWQDGTIYDEPVTGIKEIINQLHNKYNIYVVTTRANEPDGQLDVERYLDKYGITYDGVTNNKIPAIVYIDDRGITFDPTNLDKLIDQIENFTTWQQKIKSNNTLF